MKKKLTAIPRRDSHDPRWLELGKYIRYMADAMGLHEWYFDLSHDAPTLHDDGAQSSIAEVWTGSQTVAAEVRVGDTFWTKTPYEQRWAIVHEMLHVVEAPYINAIREGYEAPATTMNVVNQLRERFIDQVSLMLSRRFCLPPKGFMPVKKKEKK